MRPRVLSGHNAAGTVPSLGGTEGGRRVEGRGQSKAALPRPKGSTVSPARSSALPGGSRSAVMHRRLELEGNSERVCFHHLNRDRNGNYLRDSPGGSLGGEFTSLASTSSDRWRQSSRSSPRGRCRYSSSVMGGQDAM